MLVAGCGRVGFGPLGDAGPGADAPADAPVDADPLAVGLLAWFPMEDDPSDGRLDDASGNARDARCVGAGCPTQVTGRVGSAAQFSGAQCARVPHDPGLLTPDAYTVAAWVYLDQDRDQVAFAKPFGAADRDAWGLVAWATNSPLGNTGTCMESMNAALTGHDNVCGPQAPLDAWFHVALRWTGSAKALFMNGVKVGERAATASAIDDHDVVIGCDENSGSPAFTLTGRVDELRIYDRALADAEIDSLANP